MIFAKFAKNQTRDALADSLMIAIPEGVIVGEACWVSEQCRDDLGTHTTAKVRPKFCYAQLRSTSLFTIVILYCTPCSVRGWVMSPPLIQSHADPDTF